MPADQDGLEPCFDQLLADPRHRVDAGIQCRRDLAVTPAFAGLRGVGLEQNARPHQLLGRVLAGVDQPVEPLAFLGTELHHILLYRDLPRHHEPPPSLTYRQIDPEIRHKINDEEY
jgi:hypothetical protein